MPKTIIPKELKFQEILHDKNTHVLSKEELNKIFDIDRFNKLEYIEVQKQSHTSEGTDVTHFDSLGELHLK